MDNLPDRAALEAFVIENDELEKLEDLLQEINLFEAIGAARSEQRHSDFLAFLLDPANPHGLGDLFLRRFLQRCLVEGDNTNRGGISPIDLDTSDLNDTLVLRERDNIDVLIINERLKIAFVLENKISTKEHSNQLVRYREHVGKQFAGSRICHLFLSPLDDDPSDGAYIKTSYGLVVEILERIMTTRAQSLGADTQVLIRHYIHMVRRNLLEEGEIPELARSIYLKHRRALDLIFEHRPDMVSELSDHLRANVESQNLPLDHCSKAFIRFSLPEWDEIPMLRTSGSNEWTKTGRLLLFEIRMTDVIKLALIIGPGTVAVRERLWSMAKNETAMFKPATATLYPKFAQIWSKPIATRAEMSGGDVLDIQQKFLKVWDNFLSQDLPKLRNAVVAAMK